MHRKRIAALLGALLLPVLGLVPAACTRTYSLAPLTAQPTPTPTPAGPLIEGLLYDYDNFTSGNPPTAIALVLIATQSNVPITNASVTVTVPLADGGTLPLPYSGNFNYAPPSGSGIPSIDGGEYIAAITGYPAGAVCTFTAVVNGTTYTQAFTALNTTLGSATTGATGVTFTWTPAGNDTFVAVSGNDFFSEGPTPALSSPYILPAADFPSDPAGAGNDNVGLDVFQLLSGAFPGSDSQSVVISGMDNVVTY
jgi:hypothetical protein